MSAPFWLTWPLNIWRLLWFWGLLSLIAILIWKPDGFRRILAIAFAWIGLGLIPYCFLTYSRRIPSRQLHLASVGVAILVGFALRCAFEKYWLRRRAVVLALCALIVAHNVIYLWTKKRGQFLERAAPTERLVALARVTQGPIYVQCFPRPPLVAQSAVELMISSQGRRFPALDSRGSARTSRRGDFLLSATLTPCSSSSSSSSAASDTASIST